MLWSQTYEEAGSETRQAIIQVPALNGRCSFSSLVSGESIVGYNNGQKFPLAWIISVAAMNVQVRDECSSTRWMSKYTGWYQVQQLFRNSKCF